MYAGATRCQGRSFSSDAASESSVDFEGLLGMLEAKVAAEANAFELFGYLPLDAG